MNHALYISIIALLLLAACTNSPDVGLPIGEGIIDFTSCVAAGNAIMESDPRQCAAGGEVFVEDIPPATTQKFVVCEEVITGFDTAEFAEQIGAQCVAACPQGYDGFRNQMGIEQCITSYDAQDIAAWPVCTASSNSCQCVKTYETTQGIEIENAQFHCVPAEYAERMLFRAGLEQLDEDGQSSVMIA